MYVSIVFTQSFGRIQSSLIADTRIKNTNVVFEAFFRLTRANSSYNECLYDQNNECSVHVNDRLVRMSQLSREQQIIYIKRCREQGMFSKCRTIRLLSERSFHKPRMPLECEPSNERYRYLFRLILYKSYQRDLVRSISDKGGYTKVPNNLDIPSEIYQNNVEVFLWNKNSTNNFNRSINQQTKHVIRTFKDNEQQTEEGLGSSWRTSSNDYFS